jgi:uncharacterized protein (UPF0261 family)
MTAEWNVGMDIEVLIDPNRAGVNPTCNGVQFLRISTPYGGSKAHNPQITLMRTSVEENVRQGRWIAGRLNRCKGKVLFLLPTGGVSALDAPGQAFFDPAADAALFDTLAAEFRPTDQRRLVRVPYHINDPRFAEIAAEGFLTIAQ